jgi:hypothetical protein
MGIIEQISGLRNPRVWRRAPGARLGRGKERVDIENLERPARTKSLGAAARASRLASRSPARKSGHLQRDGHHRERRRDPDEPVCHRLGSSRQPITNRSSSP